MAPRFLTPAQPDTPSFMVWNLDLNEDGTTPHDKSFIRLPSVGGTQSCAIRFRLLIGSTASIDAALHTNYPLDGSPYVRTKFHSKKFNFSNQTELICEFRIKRPGPYQYYVTYKSIDADADDRSDSIVSKSDVNPTVERIYRAFKHKRTPTAYFLVDPQLTLGGQPLPLDGIVLQSVSPKWLGKMNRWGAQLAVSSKMGYNMLHFIPMQQRGGSDSPYSLYSQLELSDDLFDPDTAADEKDQRLRETLLEMTHKHRLLGVTDMVWNHTAYNSDWLRDHPEAGFNLENSPHLRSAYELDAALVRFSRELANYGFDRMVGSVEDVDRLLDGVDQFVIQPLRLWEFYVIDVDAAVDAVGSEWDVAAEAEMSEADRQTMDSLSGDLRNEWLRSYIVGDHSHTLSTRFGRTIDAGRTAATLRVLVGKGGDKREAMARLRELLDLLNLPYYREYDADVKTIRRNIYERVRYERLDRGSWKYGKPIGDDYKIVDPLFTTVEPRDGADVPDDRRHLANNGWIWGGNPLDNFAGPQSKAYLQREVIVWGDCVKLNYGASPEHNPWLWEYMRQYTLKMARVFHGFRIDNCHSTPIELAEYLLDEARKVNPNLYVIAELFTGSEDTDRIFVQRLGINSLIREAMQAWDPHEMSRLAHRHGGRPIGSLAVDCLGEPGVFTDDEHGGARIDGIVAPLSASLPHAIFFDCTHDNEVPAQKRTAEDALPNAAIVSLTACATGSNRGYDELYPELLNVVHESRRYAALDDPLSVGLGEAKARLNALHREIAQYQEVHVHHESEYVTVHRVHPVTREGVLMIAHCAFKGATESPWFDSPRLYGTAVMPEFAYRLRATNASEGDKDGGTLHGLASRLERLDNPETHQHVDSHGMFTELRLPAGFGPGSVLVVRTRLVDFKPNLDWKIRTSADEAVSRLSLGALNAALYRCDAEERDTIGEGAYDVPGLGPLAYCGLQGWYTHLRHIIPNNDLGHPLCAHLRQGNWALDYIAQRLHRYSEYYPEIAALAAWFEERWGLVKRVPNFMVPRYFALTVHTAYQALVRQALALMPGKVVNSSRFTHQLALTSVQLLGHVNSTGLRPISESKADCSMSAGLVHFSTHHMRCWGRDVFISLEGLLLATGRYDDAREHILAFGSTLKHGLIPNLLDGGRFPRYNARDATWFWLQAVQEYCETAPEGLSLLQTSVARRFPDGETFVPWDSDEAFSKSSTVAELIQEIMQRHARGISFREWNAGPSLDSQMSDRGFDIDIAVDFGTTGFVSGGSQWNCGTWMDKMGSSEKAGIRGVPATPRDGADVEIVGLQKSALRWLAELHKKGLFANSGVQKPDGSEISYAEWNDLVQSSFEKRFWVPLDAAEDDEYHVNSAVVNRRGIYRDTYGSATEWADYQLRPNVPIAMVVAPELFDAEHALVCLHKISAILAGPLGMRTLDPSDMRYRPNYDNSNDSNDPLVAHGINYHQGPEWLWVTGYYLRAQLKFMRIAVGKRSAGKDALSPLRTVYHELHAHMVSLKHHISSSEFAGLPELTNLNGAYCRDSCQTQAWSSGCLLMALHEMIQLENNVHEALLSL
ncbi:bifunctional 4-alpha-glucanotransferase/amylo-alpha-1,6-glucosidase [Coemansia sp. RSA 2599]|nr:bifunctional 4-alpha-glucanotransferase/amylo-alpha-1,6-glucosidase [Coemansia sp. RSA 2598]KAJ1829340.1 bifunctional 4-alpha-glucanotransferase/amylo-alpha-1,6-glucosidase [Coemansia sp. RSA 2599]